MRSLVTFGRACALRLARVEARISWVEVLLDLQVIGICMTNINALFKANIVINKTVFILIHI